MYPKPCGPTPKWGSGKPTWDGESGAWVDDEGNRRPADQRAQDKRSRRKTEAEKERARETERARKRRLKEEETKEKERRMKQELETPAGGAEGQPLHGAPPGAGAPKKQKLERKNGYDTNNDLNQLLTQCLNCPVKKDRSRGAIFSAVITQITYVEDHCDMDNYGEAQVDGHSVVGALLLVRNELQGKNLEEPRLSYTYDLKIQLHDVLLSTLGKDTLRAMVKEARKVGPKAEESKVGLKQEEIKVGPEEELKVPKEEMSLVEKLENELQKAHEALLHERQQREYFQELWIQSQLSDLCESATKTGPETNPFDDFPGIGCAAAESNAAADEADYFA